MGHGPAATESNQVIWYDGTWQRENPRLTGPMDHAFWMASVVFDGARAFDGLVPDLDLHCQRVVRSAEQMLLAPKLTPVEIEALCREGLAMLPKDRAYYIRPMFFARDGFVSPDPDSTDFTLVIYESPMPEPKGISIRLSSYRRPARDMAPTNAKASCLYPNSQRALREAAQDGYDNALLCDPSGNVAELASANIWMVRGGEALTPVWNGTFLNGITKQRVAGLLMADGIPVREVTLQPSDFETADEIFSTGNYSKVVPVTRYGTRTLQPGPVARRARELYFDWARSSAY